MSEYSASAPSNALTIIILTHNESLHIARAINSVKPIASKIIIVDSYSSDQTVIISQSLGATVLQNKFINQAKQFQWALDNITITTDWVMRLDADEIVEPDLCSEIIEKLVTLPKNVVGVNLKRKHIFMDRWVRHGGRYPLLMLRIWRKGHGKIEDRWMDEHIVAYGGKIVTFQGGFSDHNLNDLSFFTDKHNKYATREALEILIHRLNLFERTLQVSKSGSSLQASAKRFIKEHIYNHIPFALSASLYFTWRYIFQLGFLDGRSGLVYHFLQGYWYRFLVGAKTLELERSIRHLSSKQDIAKELSKLTGHNITTPIDQCNSK